MPIWLRKFTHNKIYESKKIENDQTNPSKKKENTNEFDWMKPDKSLLPIKSNTSLPDYISKASKT